MHIHCLPREKVLRNPPQNNDAIFSFLTPPPFSKGVYFAESVVYCNNHGYFHTLRLGFKRSRLRQLFLVRVATGGVEKRSGNWAIDTKGPSPSHDSILADIGGPGSTIVSYTPNANYPAYLVSYELTPEGKEFENAMKKAKAQVTPEMLEARLKELRGEVKDCGPLNRATPSDFHYDIRIKPTASQSSSFDLQVHT